MNNCIRIADCDNVAVVTGEMQPGDRAVFGDESVAVCGHVPAYHKIAWKDIAKGEPVIKYGQIIGMATENIAAGAHVHTHNLVSLRQDF